MIALDNYHLDKESNHVVFSARPLITIEHDEAMEMGKMPKRWNEALHDKIDFEKYDQYSVCTHECLHGFYNRLTDYKGIWKLLGIADGIADCSYDVNKGRVYWGITKTLNLYQQCHIRNVAILLPRGKSLPIDEIKQLWEDKQIGFEIHPNKDLFQIMQNIMPNAYLIYYTENEGCRLELYGFQVENKFDLSDIV